MQTARRSMLSWRWTRGGVLTAALAMGMGLSGCDQLGIETPERAAEKQIADAKAIGGACRHAMRAIEDCYILNPKAEKSAVFGGWRDMDEYMRENKLEGVAPVVPRPPPPAAASKPSAPVDADEEEAEDDEHTKKGAGKSAKSDAH